MLNDEFVVKKHRGIIPQEVPRLFYIQHFCPYDFVAKYAEDKKILEIGFGDGYGSFYLSKFAKQVIAIDLFKENVDKAIQKYKSNNLVYRQGDGTNLDFCNCEFDIVCLSQVIEHIKQTEHLKFLSDIKRILKTDGTAFISTLNRAHNIKNKNYSKNIHHDKEFDYSELSHLLSSVFKDVQIWGLFMTQRHIFYNRLKKIGLNKFLPQRFNIVNKFYDNVETTDFMYRKKDLDKAIDFLAVCKQQGIPS